MLKSTALYPLLVLLFAQQALLTRGSSLISRIIQCCNPIDRHNLLLNSYSNEDKNKFDIMTLDPTDDMQIERELDVCDQRIGDLQQGSCSKLSYELVRSVSIFLAPYEAVIFRRLTRRMFINDLKETRLKIYTFLKKQLTYELYCLHTNSLSASYLCDIIDYIKAMPESPDIVHVLDRTTNIDELLTQTLDYYQTHDIKAFWKILDAVLKTQISVSYKLKLDLTLEMFDYACKSKLICLGKYLLKQISGRLFCDCCLICLNHNNFTLFKFFILKKISHFQRNQSEALLKIFKMCIDFKNIDFAEFMLKSFHYQQVSNAYSLFAAIDKQDINMIQLLIKYRGTMDFGREIEVSCFKKPASLMSYAVLKNDESIIDLLHSIASASYINLFKSYAPLYFSIESSHTKAFLRIIDIVTQSGIKTLDTIYKNEYIALFLVSAVLNHDLKTLDVLLRNIESQDIAIVSKYPDHDDKYYFLKDSTILHYCIKINFHEGFDALIEHFGVATLDLLDKNNKSLLEFSETIGRVHFVTEWTNSNNANLAVTIL